MKLPKSILTISGWSPIHLLNIQCPSLIELCCCFAEIRMHYLEGNVYRLKFQQRWVLQYQSDLFSKCQTLGPYFLSFIRWYICNVPHREFRIYLRVIWTSLCAKIWFQFFQETEEIHRVTITRENVEQIECWALWKFCGLSSWDAQLCSLRARKYFSPKKINSTRTDFRRMDFSLVLNQLLFTQRHWPIVKFRPRKMICENVQANFHTTQKWSRFILTRVGSSLDRVVNTFTHHTRLNEFF